MHMRLPSLRVYRYSAERRTDAVIRTGLAAAALITIFAAIEVGFKIGDASLDAATNTRVHHHFQKGVISTMNNKVEKGNDDNGLNSQAANTIQRLIAIILGLVALLLIIKIICIIISLLIASTSVAQLHAGIMDNNWVRG